MCMLNNVIDFSKKLKQIFQTINEISYVSLFVQRQSNLDGELMIKTGILAQLEYETPSLKKYSLIYEMLSGNKITGSGFDYRR